MAVEFWNERRISIMKKMCAARKSYRDIAERLGTTRSAVSGKADRMNITNNYVIPRKAKCIPKKALIAKETFPESQNHSSIVFAQPIKLIGISITEVTECRWPIQSSEMNHVFCNETRVEGSSYCQHHKSISVRAR